MWLAGRSQLTIAGLGLTWSGEQACVACAWRALDI